ncbi:acyl-CoA-binding protein [Chlamydoabsidia padenii]|nr:acyl-CoA-binding protein [Chlamydoabsidia padenii]
MPSPAFEQAAKDAKSFTKLPSDEELLELYGLFKQATIGDNNTSKPLMDFKGRYKWDAWNNNNGIPQVEAEHQYIALVERLKPQYQ